MQNLKKLRLEKGLSQEKLAQQFHITQQAIFKYETGVSQPDLDRLIEFADYFNTSVDYLIGHTDDQRPVQQMIPTNLTAEELTWLEIFRTLPADIQTKFLDLMQSYIDMK